MLIHANPPSSSTTPTDPSSAVRFDLSSPSSMTLTIIVFLTVLLFIWFSFIFARCFFSGIQDPDLDHHRRRPPLYLHHHHLRRRFQLSSPLNFSGRLGLDPDTIRALPVLTYAVGGSPSGCVVCLAEFEERERVKLIPRCGHVFHPGCIDGWLMSRGSCPVCRCTEVLGAGEFSANIGGGVQEEGGGLVGARGRSRSLDGGKGELPTQLRRTCSV